MATFPFGKLSSLDRPSPPWGRGNYVVRPAHFSWPAFWAGFFSLLSLVFFVAMLAFLVSESLTVLAKEGLAFFFKPDWFYRASRFGAASMFYGTFTVAVLAAAIACPLAFGAAILTSEFASGQWRLAVKSLMELLAGIPSVVYGLLGVVYLRPFLLRISSSFGAEAGDSLLTAGIVVGIMILPTVVSLADDAFRGVSREERETALTLGLTRQETFFHAVFPKAFPGLVSALLLGLGRAFGETIAVFLVVGRADNRLPELRSLAASLLASGQTITSKLGGSELYLAYGNPEHWSAMMALGLFLFVASVAVAALGEGLLVFGKRYR